MAYSYHSPVPAALPILGPRWALRTAQSGIAYGTTLIIVTASGATDFVTSGGALDSITSGAAVDGVSRSGAVDSVWSGGKADIITTGGGVG